MTVNINSASISSARFAEQASAPATPAAGFVRLYVNNATLPLLSMVNDAGTVTSYLGNSSGSGTGITFPSTKNPSSNVNTLDDYEEGAWTPVLSGSSGSAGAYAASIAVGRYTKIGRVVIVSAGIVLTNLGSWANTVLCSLPIPAATPGNDLAKGAVRIQRHTFTGTVIAELSSTSAIRFNVTASGAGQTSLSWSNLVTTADNFLNFSLIYDV